MQSLKLSDELPFPETNENGSLYCMSEILLKYSGNAK